MDFEISNSSKKNEESVLPQLNIKIVVLDLFLVGGKIANQKLDLDN